MATTHERDAPGGFEDFGLKTSDLRCATVGRSRGARPSHEPDGSIALVWLVGRRKRQRLRRNGGHVPPAGKGRGGADANGSARGRLDAQDAAIALARRDGRYPDQAPRSAGEADRADQGGRVARAASAAPPGTAARRRANRAAHRPRQPGGLCEERWRREQDAPERNLPIVEGADGRDGALCARGSTVGSMRRAR